VAEAIIRLQKSRKLKATVFGVCSVQEEAGFFAGAKMRAEDIRPTAALAIDVAHATDFPDMSKEKCGDIMLGGGPIITFGTVVHSMVSGMLVKVAKSHDIPFQKAVEPNYTGTDADAIFISGTGVPTGVVSIPTRYVHTPVEMVQREDLEHTVDLLVAWCEKVDDKDFRVPKGKKC
jgi:endoglucanase